MTTQETYDQMRAYYTREDTQLGRHYYACNYIGNGSEQQRCAVGCTLPMPLLEMYGEELNEMGGLSEVMLAAREGDDAAVGVFEALGIDPNEAHDSQLYRFLVAAQREHDNSEAYPEKADVVAAIDRLAASFGLKVAA